MAENRVSFNLDPGTVVTSVLVRVGVAATFQVAGGLIYRMDMDGEGVLREVRSDDQVRELLLNDAEPCSLLAIIASTIAGVEEALSAGRFPETQQQTV